MATIGSMSDGILWTRWRDRLREKKADARMSDGKIAEAMSVSRQTVNHWLTGRNEINLTDFFRLCAAIKADPCEVLFGLRSVNRYSVAANERCAEVVDLRASIERARARAKLRALRARR